MFNRNRGDCQHFPSELGPITEVTAPRPSSQDGAVDHHSSSSVESSTERLTAIPRNTTSPAASPRMGRFRLADSRSSNRSETPVTPSPPGSGNNSPNIRGTRQQSAISRDSIRSQTPNEDLNPSADRSSLHVPQSQPFAALSQPPPTPPATASNKREKSAQKVYHEYETDIEVVCSSQPLFVIRNNELHLVFPDSKNEKDTVITCSLVDSHTTSASINRKSVVCHAAGKVFYCKKLTLLSGQFIDGTKTWKLRLYQKTDTKAQLPTWEQIGRFKFSVLRLDLKNSMPVLLKDDGIVLLTVINPEIRLANSCVVVYLFPPSKVSEKDWKGASLSLPQLRIRTAKYEIQSCIIMSDHIFFSLLLPEVGAYICRLELMSLQHPKEMRNIVNLKPEQITSWKIEESTVQNCFLAVLKEDIIILSFIVTNSKTVMEIKRLTTQSISPTEYTYPFPCVMKIFTASIVPGDGNPLIAVVYHDSTCNKCCIKRIKIPSV